MVQSLDRALSILEYLSARKSAGITEIADAFQIDKSTASRIMQTFARHNMVVKNESTQKYALGTGALRLSYRVALNNRLLRVARADLTRLSQMTGATARLCAMDDGRVYILDQVCAGQGVARDADIPGMSKPFHCSAVGKTLLAYMPREEAEALLAGELPSYTERTLTDREALFDQFEEIRRQGYALNLAEYKDLAYCIAVPVPEGDGCPRYSVGISGTRDFRRDPAQFRQIIACLKESAAALARECALAEQAGRGW